MTRSLLALSLPILASCAFHLSDANPFRTEISVDAEKEIGARFHAEILRSGALVTDPILLGYVNDLGQKIVEVTEPQPFIYRFNLVRSDTLNAFAVPGGYVYLHTAVLERAGDVSELAGVLAHEVAHVRRRHIAKSRENEWMTQLAAVAAAALSGGDPAALVLAEGINVSLQLKHSRESEADADRHGIEYLVRAGYEPDGMIRFFQRIVSAYGPAPDGIPPYLFTHPALDERIPAARVTIERAHPPPGLLREDPGLTAMQGRLASLLEPVAGGSGLQARIPFDPALTDPLLERARAQMEDGRLDVAARLLADAERLEPADPRVPLQAAEVAQRRGDLARAATHLERALELDPTVPLVHYRLGLLHKRLGNPSKAVFHLEQAAAGFGPSSSLRRRAQQEVRSLSFPILQGTGIGNRAGTARDHFRIGETVVWWGSVSRSMMQTNPEIEVRWVDPAGDTFRAEKLRMDPLGRLSDELETGEATPGTWEVRVRSGDSEIERRPFVLQAADGGSSGAERTSLVVRSRVEPHPSWWAARPSKPLGGQLLVAGRFDSGAVPPADAASWIGAQQHEEQCG